MKQVVVAVALGCVVGGRALAADLPPPAPPPPPPRAPATYVPIVEPVFTWSGVYLGINGGYGFGSSTWTGPGLSASNNPDGPLVGGTLGGNYQMGAFVLGLEGDLDWADFSGSFKCPILKAGTASCTTSSDWLGTARGRAGLAWDRVLFYGTGGAAFGNVAAATTITNSTTQIGWTAGAGIEAALTPNWTAKIEYLYVDFGNVSCGAPCGNIDTLDLKENVVRAGVNYKFSW